nr:DDE-type integrase/transposase/recombinase [Paraburkholderia kirstenboschensis]
MLIDGPPQPTFPAADRHDHLIRCQLSPRPGAVERIRCPHVIVTDKLRSYAAANNEPGLNVEHRRHKRLNNRAENSHQPTRVREQMMRHFKSAHHRQCDPALDCPLRFPTPERLLAGLPFMLRVRVVAAVQEQVAYLSMDRREQVDTD